MSSRSLMVAAELVLALAVLWVPSPFAAVIVVPPVTITQLSHSVDSGWASDGVVFPDASVASDGFSASIATGDTLRLRFQAPAGKKFVVHGGHGQPGLPEEFIVDARWSAAPGLVLQNSPHTLAFANLEGQAPTLGNYLSAVALGGSNLYAVFNFRVETDFQFTALDISIVVANSLTPTLQLYSGVQGRAGTGWVTRAPTPDATLMEIVDEGVVSTTTASWGQVKSRYR